MAVFGLLALSTAIVPSAARAIVLRSSWPLASAVVAESAVAPTAKVKDAGMHMVKVPSVKVLVPRVSWMLLCRRRTCLMDGLSPVMSLIASGPP